MLFSGNPEPREAEACGLIHGLLWEKDLDLSNIIFESDCKKVEDEIAVHFTGISDFHLHLYKCRDLLNTIPNSWVNFVRREVNIVVPFFSKDINIIC